MWNSVLSLFSSTPSGTVAPLSPQALAVSNNKPETATNDSTVAGIPPSQAPKENLDDWTVLKRSSSSNSVDNFEVFDVSEPNNDNIEFLPTSLASSLQLDSPALSTQAARRRRRHTHRMPAEIVFIPVPRRKKSERSMRKQLALKAQRASGAESVSSSSSLVVRAFSVVSNAMTKLHAASTRPHILSKTQTKQKYPISSPVRKEKARQQANFPSRKYNRNQ